MTLLLRCEKNSSCCVFGCFCTLNKTFKHGCVKLIPLNINHFCIFFFNLSTMRCVLELTCTSRTSECPPSKPPAGVSAAAAFNISKERRINFIDKQRVGLNKNQSVLVLEQIHSQTRSLFRSTLKCQSKEFVIQPPPPKKIHTIQANARPERLISTKQHREEREARLHPSLHS